MDLEALRDWNTQWAGGPVSSLVRRDPRPRAAVPRMVQEILDPPRGQWSLRPGPRQVGKTTSLGHLMDALLEKGVPPRSIIYVPVDNERVLQTCEDSLENIITSCLDLHAATKDRPLYLLLDEIHELSDWDRKLKASWDHHHATVRVTATGSSAFQIGKPADFQNRIRITRMHPMKFREVVQAHPGLHDHLRSADHGALRELAAAAREKTTRPVEEFNEALEEFHSFLHSRPGFNAFLRNTFLEYCVWGGYPTIRPGCGLSAAERLDAMDAAWSNIVAKDLHHARVEKLREFRLLFRQIARNPGAKFVANKIAGDLGPKSDTISEWKHVLEGLLVVQQLPPLKENLAPHGGKDKAYVIDPGWYAYFNTVTDHLRVVDEASGVMGSLVETVLVDHLRRLQYNILGTTAFTIGYVDRPEVDLAVDLGRKWLLVEAKYRLDTRSHLHRVGGPDDLRVVASRSGFAVAEEGGVHHVPAHELALIC